MKLLNIFFKHSLLNSYPIDSPQPVNISYLWNFGFLLGICLVIQIITEIALISSNLDIGLEMKEFTLVSSTFFFSLSKNIKKTKKNLSVSLNRIICWFNSFDFIKGIKHASSLPFLPDKLAIYHKSLLGRVLRVIGGFLAFILLTSKTNISLIENHNSYFYYLIAFFGLVHIFYMMVIFTIKFSFVIYHIVKGNWIHKNSPCLRQDCILFRRRLKYLMSEGSGAFFCIKGICYASGIWFTIVGASTGLDEVIGEDFFKEMAIVKQPALYLKSSMMALNEHIYFGNYNFNSNRNLNLTISENITPGSSQSKVLAKLKEPENLVKLKASITSKPEIYQVFDSLKKELNRDILLEIDNKLESIKPGLGLKDGPGSGSAFGSASKNI